MKDAEVFQYSGINSVGRLCTPSSSSAPTAFFGQAISLSEGEDASLGLGSCRLNHHRLCWQQ